jgi:hypothetical protein
MYCAGVFFRKHTDMCICICISIAISISISVLQSGRLAGRKCANHCPQKDKEDLEELSTELELADEDELIRYVCSLATISS